ncbi:hypothetical protein GW17_00027196 [Ensete ventricosum]|nr:hypothetical protein GW17_00027196 [Ensete ventricosum]RZR85579.1 hypothetical protein BHM03_00012595 [Ensete ventricosum]
MALALRCYNAATVLPLHRFIVVMLRQHCLFTTVMLLLPFDAVATAAAFEVSLHFSFSCSSKHRYALTYYVDLNRRLSARLGARARQGETRADHMRTRRRALMRHHLGTRPIPGIERFR